MGASYQESFDVKFPWNVEPGGGVGGGGEGGKSEPLLSEIESDKETVLDITKRIYGKEGKTVPKFDRKSFDNIVDYASKLDTKKSIYNTLLDNKVPNHYYITQTIVKLKNLEKKYGKDSNQYKKTYNKAKKSFDAFSFIPYFKGETISEKDEKHKKELRRKKAGAIR